MRREPLLISFVVVSILVSSGASGSETIELEEDSFVLTSETVYSILGSDGISNLTFITTEPNVSADMEGDRINISSGNNWHGSCELIYFFDEGGVDHNGTLNLEVIPINDPPEIIDISHNLDGNVLENPYNATVHAFDADGDQLLYSWYLDGERIPGGSNITYYIYPDQSNLTLIVTDGNGGQVSRSWDLEILPPPGWGEEPDNTRNRTIFWIIFGSGGLIFLLAILWAFFSNYRREEGGI